MMSKIFLLLALIATSCGQVFDLDSCPEVQVVQDMDLNAFLGYWYELSRYWDNFQVNTKCYGKDITLVANGSMEAIVNYINTDDNTLQQLRGILDKESENSTEGRFKVTFPENTEITGEYLVIGTDYENWAIDWLCSNIGTAGSIRNAFIWTRERNPSKEVVEATLSVLRKNNINTDLLIYEDNENCTTD